MQLREELDGGNYQKVVFSSEFLWLRLSEVEQIEFLRTFLERYFKKIYIIAYIRRQDDYVSSAWSTAVRGGATEPFSRRFLTSALKQQLHYWKVLSRWSGVFGQENMIVRKYERPSLKNGDVVDDFIDAARLDPELKFNRSAPRNESLDANALEFLRLLNQHIGRDDRPPSLLPTLVEISKGPRMALSERRGGSISGHVPGFE